MNEPLPDLDALRLFVRTLESGSITGAEDTLGLPRTTARRKILALERQFGRALVHRTSTGVTATAAGQRLADRSAELVARADLLKAQVTGTEERVAGRVRICVPPGMPPSFLAGHFAALAETHPELSIHLLVRDDPRTAIPLDADFAVVLGDPPTSGPSVLSVAVRPEVRLLASPGYIEQFGSPNTLSDLAQHRLAVWDHPSQPLQLLDQHGEAFTVSPWFLSNDMNLIREFARTGHAIAVVPDPGWSVASDAELVTLFPDTTHGTFPAWFLIPTAVLHSPRVQAVLEFSRTVADRP